MNFVKNQQKQQITTISDAFSYETMLFKHWECNKTDFFVKTAAKFTDRIGFFLKCSMNWCIWRSKRPLD